METTCKLGPKGCWSDGKCRQTSNCENKVVTNADRIRAMSDEELADCLTDYSNNGGWVTETGREDCYERIVEWLQQPTEEGGHE